MFRLLLLLFAIATSWASYVPSDRIVGGYPIKIEERPFQVSIVLFGEHFCGGSIIKEDVILTAAHCLTGVPIEYLQVRVGSSYRTYGGYLKEVRKILYHEDYKDATMGRDVGLIWLTEPLEFSEAIQVISLPAQNETFADGSTAVVSGWGRLESGGDVPDILQEVVIPLVNHDVCKIEYRGMVNGDMICAGVDEGGKDACQLDSGGPLTVDDLQVGIVSFGYECAVPHFAGIYTNLANFRDWIDTQIEAEEEYVSFKECDSDY